MTWTGGDHNANWNDGGNWSDNEVPGKEPGGLFDSVLVNTPGVTIDFPGVQELGSFGSYVDTIYGLTVTAEDVTLNLGVIGYTETMLYLSGSGMPGTFKVDQTGDAVNLEGASLLNAVVTSGTTITATSSGGTLDAVTLDGTLDMYDNADVIVAGLTMNGTITGTGTITGNVTNDGSITPGDAPGTLSISGNYTQDADGTLNVYLGGDYPTGPGPFSQLAVSGTVILGGTLNVNAVNPFLPSAGDDYPIVTFGDGETGDFATTTGFFPGNGVFIKEQFNTASLNLVVGQAELDFQQEPTETSAGVAINGESDGVQVTLVDPNDLVGGVPQVLTGDNVDTVQLTPNQHSFGVSTAAIGSTTEMTVDDGVASFTNLYIDTAASGYMLTAALPSPTATTAVTSSCFTIDPNTTSKLVFSTQPTDSTYPNALNPFAVSEEDQFNNVVTSDNSTTIYLFVSNDPNGGTNLLVGNSGGNSLMLQDGVANFSGANGVTLSLPGSGYQLIASTNPEFMVSRRVYYTSQPSNAFNYLAPGQITVIATSPLALGTTNYGTASTPAQTYTVSGTNLTADIIVTAPTGVELSTDGTDFSTSLDLPESGGTVAATTVYARIAASPGIVGSISGNITDTSSGASEADVSVTGFIDNDYFNSLTISPTGDSIPYGTATDTIGGQLSGFNGVRPTTGTVTITLNEGGVGPVAEPAAVDGNGQFSAIFSTPTLDVLPLGAGYEVDFAYDGVGATDAVDFKDTAGLVITPANADIVVTPYDVPYDTTTHVATITTATGRQWPEPQQPREPGRHSAL